MQELFECGPMAENDPVSEAALLVEADNVGVGEVRSILPPRLRYRPSPCEERGAGRDVDHPGSRPPDPR